MCSLCRLPVARNHNFEQILTFLGALVPTPFYRWGPHLVCYSRPAVYVYLWNFVSISLFCRPVVAKNPNFAFFGLRHLVMSPIGISLRKLSTGAQLYIYKPSPIQRHQNRICTPTPSWRNRAHKLWRSKAWRTDRQPNRQKNQRFWPPQWRVKSEIHQTWHGDRGPRAHSCTSKTFGGLTHSFTARGHWKFGGNQTPSSLNLEPTQLHNASTKSNQILTANASWNVVQTLQILWKPSVPSSMPNFTPSVQCVAPAGEKPQNRPLE